MTTLRSISANGVAVTSSGQLVKFLLQFVTVVLLSRLIAPEYVGMMAMILVISGSSELLRETGLSLAVIQAPEISDRQRSNLFWTNCLIGGVATTALYLLANAIAHYFAVPLLAQSIQIVSVVFLINGAAALFRADLARSMRFTALAWSDVISQAIGLAVALGLALAGQNLLALVGQQVALAAGVLVTAVLFSLWRPQLPHWRDAGMGGLLRFGAASSAAQVLNYVTASLDNLLIGKFWGPASLGLYSRAYQLFITPLAQIGSPATRLAVSVLSAVRSDHVRYRRYVAAMQTMLLFLALPILGQLFALADPVVMVVLGRQWSGVAPLLRLLIPGGIFQVLSYSYYWIFLTEGRASLHLRYSVVGRVLMVACLVIAAPLGVPQVAVAASIGSALTWLTYTIFAMPSTSIGRGRLVAVAGTPFLLASAMAMASGTASRAVPANAPLVQILAGGAAAVLAAFVGFAVSKTVRRDCQLLWSQVTALRNREVDPTSALLGGTEQRAPVGNVRDGDDRRC